MRQKTRTKIDRLERAYQALLERLDEENTNYSVNLAMELEQSWRDIQDILDSYNTKVNA